LRREDVRVAILRIEGTNCEQEMHESFARLGASPEIIHLKQLLGRDVVDGERRELFDYQLLMFPGGFSAGDYVRAGAIWAARIKAHLRDELTAFVKEGYPIGGVCNGFQVLVEMGLLPALDGVMSDRPEAVLQTNDSDRFECRPTLLRHDNNGKCVFTGRLPKGEVRMIPSAHAEGKLLFPSGESERILRALEDNDQIVFRYVDPGGGCAGYPWNPNGSTDGIAGICNPDGNVFGMMPHPERVFYRHQHPDWTHTGLGDDVGDGRALFESVLEYVVRRF